MFVGRKELPPWMPAAKTPLSKTDDYFYESTNVEVRPPARRRLPHIPIIDHDDRSRWQISRASCGGETDMASRSPNLLLLEEGEGEGFRPRVRSMTEEKGGRPPPPPRPSSAAVKFGVAKLPLSQIARSESAAAARSCPSSPFGRRANRRRPPIAAVRQAEKRLDADYLTFSDSSDEEDAAALLGGDGMETHQLLLTKKQPPGRSSHEVLAKTRSADVNNPPAVRALKERRTMRTDDPLYHALFREAGGRGQHNLAVEAMSEQRQQKLRSQSFRIRSPRRAAGAAEESEPPVAVAEQDKRTADGRRRSTPNVSGRKNSFRKALRSGGATAAPPPATEGRADGWPEPPDKSAVENFLKLPEAEDYTRLRQFAIDSKGCVVNRGDSFRRKQRAQLKERNQHAGSSSESSDASRNDSLSSQGAPESQENDDVAAAQPAPSSFLHRYNIYVLGKAGVGKTALIQQFMSSEHRNPFSSEDDTLENQVNIVIDGEENELSFFESDTTEDDSWIERDVNAYLLVYSIDYKSSFRHLSDILRDLRRHETAKDKPVIVVGNKVDLERKRAVKPEDAVGVGKSYSCPVYECSVALSHGIDEILVGILAEINESDPGGNRNRPAVRHDSPAIRRFSRRKKKTSPSRSAAAADGANESGACASNLSPASLAGKLCRFWRRAEHHD